MIRENYYPLETISLRLGEKIDFNIYVKSESADEKNKYVLFCRRGEVFNPSLRAKIKLNDIRMVYYQRSQKDLVDKYLSSPDKSTGDSDTQDDLQIFDQIQRLVSNEVIPNEAFFPLPIKNLHPGMEVNFDVLQKIKRFGNNEFEYSVFLPKGGVCRFALLSKLFENGVKILYFHRRDWNNVFKYLYRNLDAKLRDDNILPAVKAGLVYDVALLWTRRFYSSKFNRTPEELEIGIELIGHILNIFHHDQNYHQWLPRIRGYDGSLYVHSLNTCLLGMGFAKYLQWPDDKIMEFGQGILLHDIGMIEVPPMVLNKPGWLSESERKLVRKHPIDSHQILKTLTALSKNPMLMVLQHHEAGDGSGYPKGLKLALINHWARILRIIDSYEALTSRRTWREKFDSLKALRVMRQECLHTGIFDINYLVEFIKFLSGKSDEQN